MSDETNSLKEARLGKLAALREQGDAYPNDFKRKDLAADIIAAHGDTTPDAIADTAPQAIVA